MAGWIQVMLSRDRTRPGELLVYQESGERLYGPVPCLGKADNAGAAAHGNPTRDPLRPYGDLPTGTYALSGWSPVDLDDLTEAHTYGSHGKLVLDPLHGDCFAAKDNGRYGLLIHGGDPSADGRLRPTYGCCRVRNGDMKELVELYRAGTLAHCRVEERE